MADACETCRFYREVDSEQGAGRCRRYPPTVVVRKDYDDVGQERGDCLDYVQPWVDDDDWCGEYVEVPRG